MVKDNETVIEYVIEPILFPHHPKFILNREFNELVNMTSGELEEWLKEEQSESSGWDKGDGSGESVGHER